MSSLERACGLYRTGIALVGKEAGVGQGQLVYFHNHSKQGPPIVLLPTVNERNRWAFDERGYLVDGPGAGDFLEALTALPREGFYAVVEPLTVSEGRVLPARSVVQVGYNRGGEAILFPGEGHGNGFIFPTSGFRFDGLTVFQRLREAGFDPPAAGPPAGGPPPEQLLH